MLYNTECRRHLLPQAASLLVDCIAATDNRPQFTVKTSFGTCRPPDGITHFAVIQTEDREMTGDTFLQVR